MNIPKLETKEIDREIDRYMDKEIGKKGCRHPLGVCLWDGTSCRLKTWSHLQSEAGRLTAQYLCHATAKGLLDEEICVLCGRQLMCVARRIKVQKACTAPKHAWTIHKSGKLCSAMQDCTSATWSCGSCLLEFDTCGRAFLGHINFGRIIYSFVLLCQWTSLSLEPFDI